MTVVVERGGSHLNPHDEDVVLESSCKQQVIVFVCLIVVLIQKKVALHKLSSEELLILGALQKRARGPINYGELVRQFLSRRLSVNSTRLSQYDFQMEGDYFFRCFSWLN